MIKPRAKVERTHEADKRRAGGDGERMSDGQEQADGRAVRWRRERIQTGGGEREERHGSQSAHTGKQVVLCCVLRETFTQS